MKAGEHEMEEVKELQSYNLHWGTMLRAWALASSNPQVSGAQDDTRGQGCPRSVGCGLALGVVGGAISAIAGSEYRIAAWVTRICYWR
jgi:hypothetical protein